MTRKPAPKTPADEATDRTDPAPASRAGTAEEPAPTDTEPDGRQDEAGDDEEADEDQIDDAADEDEGEEEEEEEEDEPPARSAASQARAAMQRRHLRIETGMAVALGVEVAGVAGLAAGGVLAWEWGERLWGRIDGLGLVLQAALAAAGLAAIAAWLVSGERTRVWLRGGALALAAVGAGGGAASVFGTPSGGRGAGGIVAIIGAVLLIGGAAGWLVGLRRLRSLFPFGLADARTSGYGNLAAVRRARMVVGPAGAAGGIAVVTGALLVVPGWVSTVDAQTASALALTGEPPTAGEAPPAWNGEVPASAETGAAAWATPGGVVLAEERGARGIDPRDGGVRWRWRDQAYQQVAATVTDQGATLVLALAYDGDDGRDRMVGLDTATGELRWERYGDDPVAGMSSLVSAPANGDWIATIEPGPPTPDPAQVSAAAVELIGSGDGETRWRSPMPAECGLEDVAAAGDTVVTTALCTADPAAGPGCRVTALDAADGSTRWTWPPEPGAEAADGGAATVGNCLTIVTPELILVPHLRQPAPDQPADPAQQPASEIAVAALDPASGAERWLRAEEDEDTLADLLPVDPDLIPVVTGGAVVGLELGDPAAGGPPQQLVVRDAATGEVRSEIPIPQGRPYGMAVSGAGSVLMPYFVQETIELSLLEVDPAAGEVLGDSLVATRPSEVELVAVSVVAGPDSLATVAQVARVEAPAAGGAEPTLTDHRLLVYGW